MAKNIPWAYSGSIVLAKRGISDRMVRVRRTTGTALNKWMKNGQGDLGKTALQVPCEF